MGDKTPLFNEEYEELKLIGKGNFGTAHIVTSKNNGTKYVAK